jgi:DNA-directed RNA polymerase specialized sigma24 family protein
MTFSRYLHQDPDYASLPDRIDEDLLLTRVQALRSGDLSVVQDIVTSLMRIVMSAVRDMKSNNDELIGIALLTLQESVLNAVTALTDDNIIPYVLSVVRQRLKDGAIETGTSFTMSARRYREHQTKGQAPLKKPYYNEADYWVVPSSDMVDIRDQLDSLVRSHRQKTIMDLKAQEYTYKEIADMLEIGEATALREIHDLRSRYDAIENT